MKEKIHLGQFQAGGDTKDFLWDKTFLYESLAADLLQDVCHNLGRYSLCVNFQVQGFFFLGSWTLLFPEVAPENGGLLSPGEVTLQKMGSLLKALLDS